jgi:hypothetical protein
MNVAISAALKPEGATGTVVLFALTKPAVGYDSLRIRFGPSAPRAQGSEESSSTINTAD